jgi:hypothetical protein
LAAPYPQQGELVAPYPEREELAAPQGGLVAPYPEQQELAAPQGGLAAPHLEQQELVAPQGGLAVPHLEQRGLAAPHLEQQELKQGALRAHLNQPVPGRTGWPPELPEQEPDSREWNPIQRTPLDQGQEERSPTCPLPTGPEPDSPDRVPEPAERYPAHLTPPDQDLEPGEEPASHPKASHLAVGRPDRARTRYGSPAESGPRCPLRRTKVEVGFGKQCSNRSAWTLAARSRADTTSPASRRASNTYRASTDPAGERILRRK